MFTFFPGQLRQRNSVNKVLVIIFGANSSVSESTNQLPATSFKFYLPEVSQSNKMKQERGDLGWYPIHLPITEAWLALMSSSNKIGMTFKFWALSSRLREVDSNHPWQFPSVVVVFVYCQVLNSTFYFSSDWNDGIKYWVLLFLCVIVKVIHILKVLVVVVDVVHVLRVLLRLVL